MVCSKCGQPGHNRPTCPEEEEVVARPTYYQRNRERIIARVMARYRETLDERRAYAAQYYRRTKQDAEAGPDVPSGGDP